MVYYKHRNWQAAQNLKRALEELGIVNVKDFMHRFLVSITKEADLIIIDKIHNLLLSTLRDYITPIEKV